MNGKNVLVTGANGHVGYSLVELLLERGYNVRASVRNKDDDNLTQHLEKLDVEIVQADLMEIDTLESAMKNMDGLFQVAAVYKTWAENPEKEIIEPSIVGGINALKAAKKMGVEKVIFTSSTAAIGKEALDGGALTEEDWNDGSDQPYAYAKTEAEKRAWKYAEENQMKLVVINPTAVIGPNFYRHTPTTMMFHNVMSGKFPLIPPVIFGYVDVRDVARGHVLAYENKEADGRHILSTGCLSAKKLISIIKTIKPETSMPKREAPLWLMKIAAYVEVGKSWFGYKPMFTPSIVREYMGKKTEYDSKKAREELGWAPMELEKSIKDTLEWIERME